MVATDEVLYAVESGIARLTINRPERRNALSWAVVGELRVGWPRPGRPRRAGGGAHRRRRPGLLRRRRPRRHGRGRRLRRPARRPGRAGPAVPRAVGAGQADHRPGAGLRPGRRRSGLALACDLVVAADDAAVRHARDRRRPLAAHDHRAAHPVDAAEEGARADDDRPPGRRRRGRAHRVRHPRRPGRPSSTTRWTSWPPPSPRSPPGIMRLGRDSFYGVLGPGGRRRAAHSCTRCSRSRPPPTTAPRASPPSPRSARPAGRAGRDGRSGPRDSSGRQRSAKLAP